MTQPEPSSDRHSSSPEPQGRKRAGRVSPFTESQQEIIKGRFPAWEAFLVSQRLQFGKDSRRKDSEAVKAWTQKAVDEIIAQPDFKDLDLGNKDINAWKLVRRVAFYASGQTP